MCMEGGLKPQSMRMGFQYCSATAHATLNGNTPPRRYLGKGVAKAVENINAIIAPALKVGHLKGHAE